MVLNGLFRLRGQELVEEIDAIIEALHEKVGLPPYGHGMPAWLPVL